MGINSYLLSKTFEHRKDRADTVDETGWSQIAGSVHKFHKININDQESAYRFFSQHFSLFCREHGSDRVPKILQYS